MARIRFKKPKISVLISEIISLTVWLFLGDRIINVLDSVIGTEYTLNLSDQTNYPDQTDFGGCDNNSVFEDAFEILGIGYSCEDYSQAVTAQSMSNVDNGLIGVIGLVMVVMVLMNFVTYN